MRSGFGWRKLSVSVKVSVWVCEGVRVRRGKRVCVCLCLGCSAFLYSDAKTGSCYTAAKIEFVKHVASSYSASITL